jgi:hypothetical protein
MSITPLQSKTFGITPVAFGITPVAFGITPVAFGIIDKLTYHHQTAEEIEWLTSREYWTDSHTLISNALAQHVPGSHVIAYVYDRDNEDVVMFAKNIDKVKFFSGKDAVFISGNSNRCHGNTAHLLATKQIDAMYSGYAMTADDGLWRFHSWGVDSSGTVVETTVERLIYCGLNTSDTTFE